MSEKSALFMARTTRFHEFARSLTTTLGVEVSLATPDSPTAAHDFDLLILDSDGIRSDRIDQIAKWLLCAAQRHDRHRRRLQGRRHRRA